ncbi:MAG: M20/M25/M40 family metallo-hydrolase [Firmicutes bacterium]|nr:M20/M25/M40 family metallo-hydrolase [Bacillota bacterium]
MGSDYARHVDADLVVEVLCDLVAIDSRNPDLVPGAPGERAIATYLGERLRDLGLEVHWQEVAPGRPNVVGILRGRDPSAPSLLWNGHLDTVGVEGMDAPFSPRREDGFVYGRGAYDMKAGLAAAVGALAAIRRAGPPPGDVLLAGVCDEEYASLGTSALVREYRATGALVLEPTALGVGLCHKGFVWVEVEAAGRAAHGSNYREGVDAILRMGRFLAALDVYQRSELMARHHPYLGSPSLHASLVEGGGEWSTYPPHCRLHLERRTLPGETDEQVRAEVERLVRQVTEEEARAGLAVPPEPWRVGIVLSRPPYQVGAGERVVRALREGYRRALGQEPAFTGSYPWTDAVLMGQAGVPCAIFGPGGGGAHARVEYVSEEQTVMAARVLAEMAAVFAGLPS